MPFLQKWQPIIYFYFVFFHLTIYPRNHTILIHKDWSQFFFNSCIVLHGVAVPSLFHHSIYKHLGCFQCFGSINNANMNNLMQVYFHSGMGILLSLLWIPTGEIGKSIGNCVVVVLGIITFPSKRVVSLCIPTDNA